MSTSKGSNARNRPQKHQNRTAFKNNLHDTSQKTKFLNSLHIGGVCQRCKDIIDWKIKYKKYKILNAPKKCVGCEQKTVKHNYHTLCEKCRKEKGVCAKCCKNIEQITENSSEKTLDLTSLLKPLPERKRRTILRFVNKNGGVDHLNAEMMAQIEELLEKMEHATTDDNDEFNFSDDEHTDSSDSE